MTLPTEYTSAAVQADMAAAAAAGGGTDFKALICIYLDGGNDAHNTVMPLAIGSPNRVAYDLFRSDTTNVGIPVDQSPVNALDADWRLHHNLAALKTLWDAGDLATVMNVGMLQEPTTKAAYLYGTAKLPLQLFSHSDQSPQWKGLPPYRTEPVTGWFGRAADLADQYFNPTPTADLSSLYSVYGDQLQLTGFEAKQNSLSTTGAVTLLAGTAHGSTLITGNHLVNCRVRSEYGNIQQDCWVSKMGNSLSVQATLGAQLQNLPTVAPFGGANTEARFTAVSGNSLAQQLKTVVRTIHSRTQLAQRRQLFMVGLGGFDNHNSLRATHDARMTTYNQAAEVLTAAIADLGLQNSVATFTASEFGRALMQNGSGVDHGWGGHHFVMGGAVNGGLYGRAPDLTANSPDDAGQGRLIPTTSVDQYAGTLLKWWGIPESRLDLVIPNIGNFPSRTIPGLLA